MDHGGPELSPTFLTWTGLGARRRAPSFFTTLCAASCLVLALACGGARSRPQPRFSNLFESPQALGREVLRALAERDRERLRELPVSEAEFRAHVYPELPAAGNIPEQLVWEQLVHKSDLQFRLFFDKFGGRRLELLETRFAGGAKAYASFVVHDKLRLKVRDAAGGEPFELAILGSVIEQDGRYKLFSYVSES